MQNGRIRKIVKPLGFWIEGGLIPFDPGTPKARNVYRISKIDGEDVLTLDLLLVSAILSIAWDKRETIEWQNQVVPVVSPEGLIHMKTLAGRKQDLADIEKLETWIHQDGEDHASQS